MCSSDLGAFGLLLLFHTGPHIKPGSDNPNRDRGFYPPEDITEDNCPDCLGLSIGQVCKIHPPRWFTQGPRKFLEVDTIKNRHKYHGPEPGSPGFDPQAYSEFLKDEEEERPYAVMYNRDVPLRPHVVAELGASDRGKDAELIYEEAVIIRGVPNFTQRKCDDQNQLSITQLRFLICKQLFLFRRRRRVPKIPFWQGHY